MNTLILLPPSIAAIVWAFCWLQRERDRKVNQTTAAAVEASTLSNEETEIALRSLNNRVTEVESHITQLTDKAFR